MIASKTLEAITLKVGLLFDSFAQALGLKGKRLALVLLVSIVQKIDGLAESREQAGKKSGTK